MELQFDGKEWVSPDELVSVYECMDGTWRVAYYPYSDKDRNLTKEQAFDLAQTRWDEVRELLQTSARPSA